jgi:macrolide-specific efflux system membrane fusion protein
VPADDVPAPVSIRQQGSGMKLKVVLILVLVVAGAGAVFVSMGGLTAQAASTRYLTSVAAVGDVSDDVAATGAVAATASYGLAFGAAAHLVDSSSSSSSSSANSSTATWTVKTVDVTLGQAVKKGQKLATAATTDLDESLTSAINSRRSAALQLEIAKENFDNASGTDAIRQARMSVYQAESQLAQAEAQQHDIEVQLAASTLVAPIDGIVSAINISPGLDAPSGDAIVVDAGTYQVTADVVESDISKVQLKQPATVSVDAVGSDIDGTVAAISPAASSTSGGNGTTVVSYAVTVTLTNPPAALKSGMTADITITTASATNVLTVPAAALVGTTGNYAVRVLGPDGQPQVKPVDVGLVTSALAEITGGLNQGEAVITGTASDRTQTTVTNAFGPGGATFVGAGGGRFQGGNGGAGR